MNKITVYTCYDKAMSKIHTSSLYIQEYYSYLKLLRSANIEVEIVILDWDNLDENTLGILGYMSNEYKDLYKKNSAYEKAGLLNIIDEEVNVPFQTRDIKDSGFKVSGLIAGDVIKANTINRNQEEDYAKNLIEVIKLAFHAVYATKAFEFSVQNLQRTKHK